jgi:hypothetical protein
MKGRLLFICFLLLIAPLTIFGQSNQLIDEILGQQELQIGHAAYILLVTTQDLDESATTSQAFTALTSTPVGSRFANKSPQDTLSLGEFAYLAQGLLTIPKGLFSTIFPSPRYAVRDLRFMGIIQGRSYPGMAISGERGLRIINRALSERERRL